MKSWRILKKEPGVTGSYKITKDAQSDLDRIWRRGFKEWNEARADKYYNAFFDRFELLACECFLRYGVIVKCSIFFTVNLYHSVVVSLLRNQLIFQIVIQFDFILTINYALSIVTVSI